MKSLFKLILIVTSITLYSCKETEDIEPAKNMTEAESLMFFKENMSIFDARVRTLDERTFVKELYLANFSQKSWNRNQIGFENMIFQDNGEGNDLVANDGIFTSARKFNFSNKVKYQKGVETFSVMDVIVISPQFKHTKKLDELKSNYNVLSVNNTSIVTQSLKPGPKAELTCDVEICSSGCIADWVWDGFGCICVSNCKVTIGWG
jgi:hypothetical protein